MVHYLVNVDRLFVHIEIKGFQTWLPFPYNYIFILDVPWLQFQDSIPILLKRKFQNEQVITCRFHFNSPFFLPKNIHQSLKWAEVRNPTNKLGNDGIFPLLGSFSKDLFRRQVYHPLRVVGKNSKTDILKH